MPENIVEEMATGFGYDLYLIYASRHWKNESKKIVEKFNHSLSGYIYASIVNRVNFSSTKESHDCQENDGFQKDVFIDQPIKNLMNIRKRNYQ